MTALLAFIVRVAVSETHPAYYGVICDSAEIALSRTMQELRLTNETIEIFPVPADDLVRLHGLSSGEFKKL